MIGRGGRAIGGKPGGKSYLINLIELHNWSKNRKLYQQWVAMWNDGFLVANDSLERIESFFIFGLTTTRVLLFVGGDSIFEAEDPSSHSMGSIGAIFSSGHLD